MMKSFKAFFIYLSLVIILAFSLLFMVAGSSRYTEVDSIKLNGMVQTVKENWHNLDALRDMKFDVDMLVFDKEDEKIYETSNIVFDGIDVPLDAVKEGYIIMPVNDKDKFLGTVVFANSSKVSYQKTVTKLFLITLAIAGVLLISYIGFIYYINRNVIKPFNRMKEFATLVAQGRLDEPLIMDKNNVFGAFTESFDIMREELKASKQREIALKMKEKELVASLSHDLKTPVTGIRAICGVLSVKVQDEYVKAKIDNIEQKTHEISTLLNDLLASALDDLGEMNVNVSEEEAAILNAIVKEHDIYGKVNADEVPDCILKIDKNRMSQVIGNIINNSYKYADTKIEITYKFNGKHLEMRIRDYGDGVDPEEVDFLANKFYRGKKNTAGKEGSGLGLYISTELMKKMQGQLICISNNDGFEVMLLIPLA